MDLTDAPPNNARTATETNVASAANSQTGRKEVPHVKAPLSREKTAKSQMTF